MDELIGLEYLFEVSRLRPEVLKDADDAFVRLKKDIKDLQAKKDLTNTIKEFSGISSVVISIKPDFFNVAVIPVYNRQLSLDVIDILKDYKPTEEKRVETVEEPSDYIKKIYIIIGVEAMHVWTPRELTAIMLHELGHVFIHTANLPGIIIGIVKKIVAASIPTRIAAGAVLQYLGYLTGSLISISTFFSIGVLLFFVSHSLTFLEHRTEYKADQFAAKYGYGDEMIKALYKIHHIEVKKIEQTPWYKKILKALWEFFIYAPDHPPSSKRIERLSDDIEESYKQMYPKLSKELNIIISDIKSEA